jgi:hypothetical protein
VIEGNKKWVGGDANTTKRKKKTTKQRDKINQYCEESCFLLGTV